MDGLAKIEKQVVIMARDISRLKSDVKANEQTLTDLEKELSIVKMNLMTSLSDVNSKLIEAVTRVKTQTKFTLIMLTTLIPAQIALLWKIFSG